MRRNVRAPTGVTVRGWALLLAASSVAVPAARVEFTRTTWAVEEGEPEFFVEVQLSDCPARIPGGLARIAVVGRSGTAVSPNDYSVPAPVELGSSPPAEGEHFTRIHRRREIPVHIVDDDEEEGDEFFTLELVIDPSQRVDCGSGPEALEPGSAATVTILANDEEEPQAEPVVHRPGELRFSSALFSASESQGQARITVDRRNGSEGRVTVVFTTRSGTADQDADFWLTGGILQWEDGDTSTKSFFVKLLADGITEGAETVLLRLERPSGGAILTHPTEAILRISDR